MEVAELDEVPDVGERGAEDSADADFVGGGSRHAGDCPGFNVRSFVAGRRMVSLLVSVSIDEWIRATMFKVLDIAEDQITRCGVDD